MLPTPYLDRLRALSDAQTLNSCPDCYRRKVVQIVLDACKVPGLAGAHDLTQLLREVSGFDPDGMQDCLASAITNILRTLLQGPEGELVTS